jgi:hypothetical protein
MSENKVPDNLRIQPSPLPGSEEEQFLTADAILSASDIDVLKVKVPEWGGTICFVALTAQESIDFYKDFNDPEKKDEAVVRLFAASAVNNPTERKRIFTEAKIEQLKKKKFGVFLRLQKRLLAFNGMGKDSEATAKND